MTTTVTVYTKPAVRHEALFYPYRRCRLTPK